MHTSHRKHTEATLYTSHFEFKCVHYENYHFWTKKILLKEGYDTDHGHKGLPQINIGILKVPLAI